MRETGAAQKQCKHGLMCGSWSGVENVHAEKMSKDCRTGLKLTAAKRQAVESTSILKPQMNNTFGDGVQNKMIRPKANRDTFVRMVSSTPPKDFTHRHKKNNNKKTGHKYANCVCLKVRLIALHIYECYMIYTDTRNWVQSLD